MSHSFRRVLFSDDDQKLVQYYKSALAVIRGIRGAVVSSKDLRMHLRGPCTGS